MIGDGILAAPLTEKEDERTVYLPAGSWYDFNTGQKYEGGKQYTIKPALTQLPIFIKGGTILPLAKPVEHVTAGTVFEITCYVYGTDAKGATLFEDDGLTFNYEKGSYNMVTLQWKNNRAHINRKGTFKNPRYMINKWVIID